MGGSAGLGAAVAAGAIGSAIGSVAGQTFGVVTGMQSEFNWSAVGLAAISGGVGAGMGALASGTGVLSGGDFGVTVARAAVGSALTQGISVATGLQDHFSWASVAASAVGAGVGYGVGSALQDVNMNPYVKAGITSFAAGTAAAVARGGTVSIQQIATDVFGQSLASAFVNNMGRAGTQENRLTQNRQENIRVSEPAAASDSAGMGLGSGYIPSGNSYQYGELGSGSFGADLSLSPKCRTCSRLPRETVC